MTKIAARTSILLPAGVPATSGARPLRRALPVRPRSRETRRTVGEWAREAAAEARKAARELVSSLNVGVDAAWAYADLNHALLLAGERGQDVPCQGPGSAEWTSDDYDDQQVAADRCLDCPALTLCEQYRAVALPAAGTWAGVTSDPARKPARHPSASKLTSRVAPVNRPECLCGCGGVPKRARYLPGHDSLHLSVLLDEVRSGRFSAGEAVAELGHSERLQAKLTRYLGGR